MHFAVLGTDPDVLALMGAANSLGHTAAWIGDIRPADADAVARLGPTSIAPSTDWETLLDQATADAVIVGRGTASEELRAEQLKRLATDAVPLLVTHPISGSVLTYYELDMIRRETRGILRHYNPLVGQPTYGDLAGWVRDGHPRVGAIHQVSCERHIGDDERDTVLDDLARDVEMLAVVAGGIRKVSAAGLPSVGASLASLQVQMMTSNPATVRWSTAPRTGSTGSVDVTLVGQRGLVILHVPADEDSAAWEPWTLEELYDDERRSSTLPGWNAPAVAIEQLASAVAEPDLERRGLVSTWDRATQAMEVVEAVELSLQKGRTMEVHQQQLTEQLAFRGTMAAMGCGLLVLGLAVLVLASLLGGLETILGQRLLPAWPVVLLAVLAVFLLLQAVPLLVARNPRDSSTSATIDDLDGG
jgi:predicted dehydrogenase